MRFIVYAPWKYTESSGGVVALHKLAHDLDTLSQEAYIYAESKPTYFKNKLLYSKVLPSTEFIANSVVIYPEIVLGNPLKAKTVVRWLLNSVGVLGGNSKTWEVDDVIYTFAPYFDVDNVSKGELTVLKPDLDFWVDLGKDRKGECYTIRKGKDKELNLHSADAILVDGMNNNLLQEVFNKSKTFICYDSECFLAVQATLCGCKTIVIPRKNVSLDTWKKKFPYFSEGICYGFEDQDSFNPEKTRSNIKALEGKCLETVSNFISNFKK